MNEIGANRDAHRIKHDIDHKTSTHARQFVRNKIRVAAVESESKFVRNRKRPVKKKGNNCIRIASKKSKRCDCGRANHERYGRKYRYNDSIHTRFKLAQRFVGCAFILPASIRKFFHAKD